MAEVKAEFIWLNPDAANDNSPHGGADGSLLHLSASADGAGYAPLAVAIPGTTAGTTQISYVHGNHQGVPVLVMNSAGTAITPSGYALPGYPGQSRTLADLYYNRYRDYDSSTGRYIQADPIGLGGDVNPYVYAEGNPVNAIDPLGLQSTTAAPPLDPAQVAWDAGIQVMKDRIRMPTRKGLGTWLLVGDFIGTTTGVVYYGYINPPCPETAKSKSGGGNQGDPCKQLAEAVQAAKSKAAGLGKCMAGMSVWQLRQRRAAWLELAIARSRLHKICFKGGDKGHQDQLALNWGSVGKCDSLL
jgi:RHS repeat-associated protein